MIDQNFKYFYTLKNNRPIEKLVLYRVIGIISFFTYLMMIVSILELKSNSLETEMWILISLIIIEKIGYFIYFYTHRQYKIWYYHIIWELFHYDPSKTIADEFKQPILQGNNQVQRQNKYNFKIPLNLLNSVIFHYSALSYLQSSELPQEKQINFMIISVIQLFTNQVLLYQRLYFRNLINFHQYLLLIAEGLSYQYSQLSLLALIQQVGDKWYVYIIAFIFAAISLSMILERNTRIYFTESLIYLMISQVFGLRLDGEFLYSKFNDRCQKMFSYVLYVCFTIVFWTALVLLVIYFGGTKLYYLNFSIVISFLAVCFFSLPQICLIVRYFLKSPTRINCILNTIEQVQQIKKKINPLTKIIDVQMIQSTNISVQPFQMKVLEYLVSNILFMNKDILYNLMVMNHQKEVVLQIESVYDSQKIRVHSIRLMFENITQLDIICYQIHKQRFNYYEFIVNLQVFESKRYQTLTNLIKYPFICLNMSKQSNIYRLDDEFQKYCQLMKQTLYQISGMQKHIQYIVFNNPFSIYYDLFDDLTENNDNIILNIQNQ